MHTEIREGGCDGTPRYQSDLRPGALAELPPVLRPGRWGFAAEARTDTCLRFAGDCDELVLPGPTRVASTLHALAESAVCDAPACTSGACAMPDAGLDAAVAPLDVAMVPRDAAACPDAPRDAGTPLLPYLPCGSTLVTDGELLAALEVRSGSLTPIADFYHRDGLCSGCTDAVIQLAAGTELRGHFASVREISLLVARQPGGGSLALEVCGRPYSGPTSLAASGDPGFNNIPAEGTAPIAETGECDFVIRATGGVVTIRRFDVACHVPAEPPTVSVLVDGMESRTLAAPASPVLSWSTTGVRSCEAMGAWSGTQHVMGSIPLLDLCAGRYSYALSCLGPGGATVIDIAELTVE